jgi:hypothetical protein
MPTLDNHRHEKFVQEIFGGKNATEATVESMIKEFANAAKDAKTDKQHGAVVSALTAVAKLAGLWVDRSENLNGNYAISDKPLSEQEWVEKYVKY